MKIKLPFTEKFLWGFYNFSCKTLKVIDLLTPDVKFGSKGLQEGIEKIFWPDIYAFRDEWEKKHRSEQDRKRFAKLVCRLRDGGYLKTLRVKGKSATILTPRGLEKLFKVRLKMMDKKRRKDKKWQMVLFDIPENKRKYRDWFRKSLQYLGYKKLQKSIWVCPYDVQRETKDLIKRYKIEPYVELLSVKKIGLG